MSFTLNRRDFLQFTAGGAIGLATSGISLRSLSLLNAALAAEEVRVPGGPEAWKLSICTQCAAGCGLKVRTIGGRAVKIQGNPLHPVNHGGLCPRGLAGLQTLYHPDRLQAPLRNAGSREAPRWEEISWQEALATISNRLRTLRDAGQAHTVALMDRSERNLLSRLLRKFLAAYGSPNYFAMPTGLEALEAAVYLQQGTSQPVAYDFENARYLVSFGVNLLEGWGAPTAIMRAFGRWRDAGAGRRTKFVQVEPRFSLTAARADEWIALRPGTEAALALGIAYVLITEGLYDADFVREHTFGFDDWRDAAGKTRLGFRSLVLSEYRLSDVAAVTGVPPEKILRIAREFGLNRPAIALGDHQTSTLPGNPYAAMAAHSLNALVGSVGRPGGVVLQAELPQTNEPAASTHWPRIDRPDARLVPGYDLGRLPNVIRSAQPYRIQALFLHDVNPVFALPAGDEFRRAFQEVPFIVSFASFLDESAALADLVLPAATDLERWQDAVSPPTFPYAVQSVSPPAVAARHAVRHPGDVVLEISRMLGGSVATALSFANFEEYLQHQVKELFALQSGSVFTTSLEDTWNRLLERSGWWAPSYSTAEELWEQMKQQGGWWEPAYQYEEWDRIFQTPSRRFEFFSTKLADWARERPEFARAMKRQPGDDHLFLPHQPPIPEATSDYPLLLLPIEVLPLAGGRGAELPLLEQIPGPHLFANWGSWLEIHPETAGRLGIADGEEVWVESRRGRMRVRARHYQGVRPDVVHMPLGYGHTEGSPWGRRGANPLGLIEPEYEPLAGLPQTGRTYVKVYRS